MDLAFGGWNYDLAAPLAAAAVCFSMRRSEASWKWSLIFWGAGLAGAVLWAMLFLRSDVASPSVYLSGRPTLFENVHKAIGLGSGVLLASYVPFGVIAVLQAVGRRLHPIVYAVSATVAIITTIAILPPLAVGSAIVSCVLLQVPRCL